MGRRKVRSKRGRRWVFGSRKGGDWGGELGGSNIRQRYWYCIDRLVQLPLETIFDIIICPYNREPVD